MTALSPTQVRRYARHVLLPDVGGVGQRRMLAAELAIEVRGAACRVAALYLAAAGVGRLWLDAGDRRVTSTSARFPLGPDHLGQPIALAMRNAIAAAHPEVELVVGIAPTHVARLDITDDADDLDLASAFARGGAAAARWLHPIAAGDRPHPWASSPR